MITDIAIKPFVTAAYSLAKNRERQLGYRLDIRPDPEKWIDSTTIYDMQPVWKRYGVNATGVNYFTIGKVINGRSSRYDPSSLYFQSWLGGYIVKFYDLEANDWNIKQHYKLGSTDQKHWLSLYGDPNPQVECDLKNFIRKEDFVVDGRLGTLYQAGGWSNIDVGNGRKSVLFPLLMRGFAHFFKQSKPNLQLSHTNLYPIWDATSPVTPYQKVRLEGYLVDINLDDTTKAVLYVNGVQYTDKHKQEHDTFSLLHKSFLKDLENIKISKV